MVCNEKVSNRFDAQKPYYDFIITTSSSTPPSQTTPHTTPSPQYSTTPSPPSFPVGTVRESGTVRRVSCRSLRGGGYWCIESRVSVPQTGTVGPIQCSEGLPLHGNAVRPEPFVSNGEYRGDTRPTHRCPTPPSRRPQSNHLSVSIRAILGSPCCTGCVVGRCGVRAHRRGWRCCRRR